jgi:hypothetical protein
MRVRTPLSRPSATFYFTTGRWSGMRKGKKKRNTKKIIVKGEGKEKSC